MNIETFIIKMLITVFILPITPNLACRSVDVHDKCGDALLDLVQD